MKDDKLYKEDINLTMLAAKLDLRQHQLSEILNSCLNTTFGKYINDLRIKEAALLLESHPELQIIEISLETGFNSLSVFYREFKKRTGISPAEHRRKNGL
jgi:AraC-like DNA-binding protein